MKKKELQKALSQELLDRLYGYCYRRCQSSTDTEDLCSEILVSILTTASTEGDITHVESYIWKIAHNVYANFSRTRRMETERRAAGELDSFLAQIPFHAFSDLEDQEEDAFWLRHIWKEISFLSKAYRDVMILYYLEEKSISQIADTLGITQTTVRQRLFSAKNTVRNEVIKMNSTNNATASLPLQKLDFVIWGTGRPAWGDPRNVCFRQFSKHVVWLCRNKSMSAKEISNTLHVPMPYVEEELEIQSRGENGEYGFLKKLENGKYIINFILLSEKEVKAAHQIYHKQMDMICKKLIDFIQTHKKDYLNFPYLNKKVDLNLILWAQVHQIAYGFGSIVESLLKEKYFPDVKIPDRPFSVFGWQSYGKDFGGGWDGVSAENLCGYQKIYLENIYNSRIQNHFHCGHDIANDRQLQLTIRAVHGLSVSSLSEEEKEDAANAIACGYLYREGDMLYTKILTMNQKDREHLFDINPKPESLFLSDAEKTAAEIAALIHRLVPEHLIPEYIYFNRIASLPLIDALVEALIQSGLLTPPENGIGAEGCFMSLME